jgi:hypothetical protein
MWEFSTCRTQADLAFSSESVTESLRRSRQLMAQEVEHQTSTLATMGEESFPNYGLSLQEFCCAVPSGCLNTKRNRY